MFFFLMCRTARYCASDVRGRCSPGLAERVLGQAGAVEGVGALGTVDVRVALLVHGYGNGVRDLGGPMVLVVVMAVVVVVPCLGGRGEAAGG